MKLLHWLTLLALGFNTLSSSGAETAQARLYCLSPRVQTGRDNTTEYSLALTTLSSEVNGELMPYTDTSYSCNIILTDLFLDESDYGFIDLPWPSAGDANGNGFDDFFESSQAISISGTGDYNLDVFGSGNLQVTWTRNAGSSIGTCLLKFKPQPIYTWLTFALSFQILEYTGPLSYTPDASSVSGTLNWLQTDNTNNFLSGPASFFRTGTNRFNELTLQAGTWTNESLQTLTFADADIFRDAPWPTNYYGLVIFDDGDPNTGDPDYNYWQLSIDDTNDGNHNGIPDFSDDPSSAPRRPSLGLGFSGTNLVMTIHGDTGHNHLVQAITSLTSTNWQTVTNLSLATDPQPVTLARPGGRAQFWRVLAQ